jgi:hypothetical protein
MNGDGAGWPLDAQPRWAVSVGTIFAAIDPAGQGTSVQATDNPFDVVLILRYEGQMQAKTGLAGPQILRGTTE